MTENKIGTHVIEAALAVHRKRRCLLNFGKEDMEAGIPRCMNGFEEQPLRPCGRKTLSTMGCCFRRRGGSAPGAVPVFFVSKALDRKKEKANN